MINRSIEPPQPNHETTEPVQAFLKAAQDAARCSGEASPENFWWDGERPRDAAAARAWERVQRAETMANARVRTAFEALPVDQRLTTLQQAEALYFGTRGLLTDEQLAALVIADPEPASA